MIKSNDLQSGISDDNHDWPNRKLTTLLIDLDGTLLGAHEPWIRIEFIARSLIRLRTYVGTWRALLGLRAVSNSVAKDPKKSVHVSTNAERAAQAFAKATQISVGRSRELLRSEISGIFPRLERYFFPVPGAKEFITWAKPRYKLILATNPVWPLEQVKLRLKWAGIDPAVFDSITHSERMHACKPTPQYYNELLSQEGLLAKECLLLGDDIKKDLPATRVGIAVFILNKKVNQSHIQSFDSEEGPSLGGSYLKLTQLLTKAPNSTINEAKNL